MGNAKLISGVFWFSTDQIETIDARDWPVDVLVMVKGYCGPLDTHPIWITRQAATELLFPGGGGVNDEKETRHVCG